MLNELREKYRSGTNITTLLKDENGQNPENAIELAYEMQAGSYIAAVKANPQNYASYFSEIAGHLQRQVGEGMSLLDCGTGEMTTLTAVATRLPPGLELTGLDISLSRLILGRDYAESFGVQPSVVCAALGSLPIVDRAFDITMTTHALEPNHGREREMLDELMRVTRHRLVLFEPSYEDGNDAVRERMERLGYVRSLDRHIADAGGVILEKTLLSSSLNPLNPTCCWVVEVKSGSGSPQQRYRCVRSGAALEDRGSYMWSAEGLYAYPKLNGIPILKHAAAIPLAFAPVKT